MINNLGFSWTAHFSEWNTTESVIITMYEKAKL